ncbi:hypothetical protein BEL05_14510 [Shewanella colwelliana]|uniref:Uncharacterized protein n=1 Tax=Shewanella colwelliana TaxID=23 RepID=A0A1E5IY51_SHECO|nr:hypothetical protein [Shewanella colwelliana]OEG75485.1 hypothetical protein BEL05_14510 [Shewanella colwelliana]
MKIPQVNKAEPDVLRVTAYVLQRGEAKESYSVCEAAKSAELNGISDHRIAEILKEICLEPDGPESMASYTKVDGNNSHNNPGRWQLNSQTYFSYLSYLSLLRSEESIELAKCSLIAAEQSNTTSKTSMWIATLSMVIAVIALLYEILPRIYAGMING